MVDCIYQGVTGNNFEKKKKKKNSEFLSLKIVFVLTDSENPDEMLHYAAFHQGLHCLPKYAFRSHQ